MKMTRASSHAISALARLARQEDGKLAPSHHIAREQGIPEKFLLKTLRSLTAVGILDAVKGPHGGYRLNRPAKDITLLEAIEAVDGPVRGNAPAVGGHELGPFDKRLQAVCDAVAEQIRDGLEKTTVADLAGAPAGKKKKK
jgi:Rrf2 family protein